MDATMRGRFRKNRRFQVLNLSHRPITDILATCRPLGEMPTHGIDRWPVTKDRTRRIGLPGDFSQ
jgi:hypothetical protein